MNKSKAQVIHAKRRAKQRYNISLNAGNYKALIKRVHNQKAQILYRQSLRISIKMIEYENKNLYFVYDNKRKKIVTFLTEDQLDKKAIEEYKNLIILKSQENSAKIDNLNSFTEWSELKEFLDLNKQRDMV